MSDYDIDSLVNNIDFQSGSFKKIGNLMLTNHEISILEEYDIDYKSCKSLKDLIFLIEDVLNDLDISDQELESISLSISERDYYNNTNK